MNETRREADEHENGDDLEKHHDVVGFGGFANPADQNYTEQHDDDESRPIEAEVPTGTVEHVAGEVAESAGQVRGRNPSRIGVDAKPVEKIDHVGGETYADGHVGDRVFEDEVPADDPRDEFAHGGVGVSVGAAGDWNHCRKFGVTDGGKCANDRNQNKRDGDGGPGSWTAE